MRNPILPPSCHMPDCEARVMGGRLFLYGSWDKGREDWCSEIYHTACLDGDRFCVGPASFRSSQVPWAEQGERLYAPDCVERDGRYYLYFCMAGGSEGVAVADRPEGPFRDPVRLPVSGIDPAVLVDDDGQAYYFWGQFSACGAKLKRDMRTLETDSIVRGIVTEKDHFFHEGFSIRRHGGLYYAVYADISGGRPTALGYATATRPLGPYTYRGVIIDNVGCDPESWNNHGSIALWQGQWYVFYHRSSQRSKMMRRVCMEPIRFLEDGSIERVRMTSTGGGRDFDMGEEMEAFRACEMRGGLCLLPETESGAEAGATLAGGIGDGDEMVFRYLRLSEAARVVANLRMEGEAEVCVFMNGRMIRDGDRLEAGRYEVKLVFRKPRHVRFYGVTLTDDRRCAMA